MSDEFTCDACRRTFEKAWTDAERVAEAEAAFTPAELEHTADVCEPCWLEMRAAMPDLDARYADDLEGRGGR